MSQTLSLPDGLFNKLAQGAAQRGLTIEALLAIISELVVMPAQPTARDRQRSRRIERLLARYRGGPLTEQDRADLDRLIDRDYQGAIARADRLIAAKECCADARGTATAPPVRSSPKPAKPSRK
jgi:hypothetical protein